MIFFLFNTWVRWLKSYTTVRYTVDFHAAVGFFCYIENSMTAVEHDNAHFFFKKLCEIAPAVAAKTGNS